MVKEAVVRTRNIPRHEKRFGPKILVSETRDRYLFLHKERLSLEYVIMTANTGLKNQRTYLKGITVK